MSVLLPDAGRWPSAKPSLCQGHQLQDPSDGVLRKPDLSQGSGGQEAQIQGLLVDWWSSIKISVKLVLVAVLRIRLVLILMVL